MSDEVTVSDDRFAADRGKYHILRIDESCLELAGGGDFYENADAEPDAETWETARELAERHGMRITSAHGEWEGWSEYSPDPGDVSVFKWERM